MVQQSKSYTRPAGGALQSGFAVPRQAPQRIQARYWLNLSDWMLGEQCLHTRMLILIADVEYTPI